MQPARLGAFGSGFASTGAAALLGPAAILAAGAIIGKLIFDAFNQPGRIQLEKTGLADFLDDVFPDESFSVFQSKTVRERVTGTPEEWQQAGRASGTAWAISFGDEATQGTIKRFGNQFLTELIGEGRSPAQIEEYFSTVQERLGGLEGILDAANRATTTFSDRQGNMLLSLAETSEELDEQREKLSRYGDVSNLTLRELNSFAEANNRVNEEIISYNDIVSGAITVGF